LLTLLQESYLKPSCGKGGINLVTLALKRQGMSDRIFSVVNYVFLIIFTVIFLYPLIYVLSCSFSGAESIWGGKVFLLPVGFTTAGYELVFENKDIWIGYLNTIIYTVSGTAISVFFTLLTAYPLSRKDFMPRNIVMLAYVICMYFNGGLIPTYLLVKRLGLIDTIWALIIPGAISTYNVIIARTFFATTIPTELYEASEMDGCSNTGFYFRVVLPLSKPIIAVFVLFTAVGYWNMYFNALIYLTNRDKYPLQLILREILITAQMAINLTKSSDIARLSEMMQTSENLKYAVIIVTSLPVLILYPFLQKYFVRGIMVGSIKF